MKIFSKILPKLNTNKLEVYTSIILLCDFTINNKNVPKKEIILMMK